MYGLKNSRINFSRLNKNFFISSKTGSLEIFWLYTVHIGKHQAQASHLQIRYKSHGCVTTILVIFRKWYVSNALKFNQNSEDTPLILRHLLADHTGRSHN